MGSDQTFLCLAIFLVAVLYSSVGHGGASGYLAVLSLLSFPRQTAVPSALILNVLVSCTAFVAFKRAGHFQWKLALPFILGSIPAAYIGGTLKISHSLYSILLAAGLSLAAIRISFGAALGNREKMVRSPPTVAAIALGATIGLISGMIGIGGGVFLSPILLLMGWADSKQTAAASACFILVNSIAALLGGTIHGAGAIMPMMPELVPLVVSGFIGGWIGSIMGARYFPYVLVLKLLSSVLWIASFKLIYSAL